MAATMPAGCGTESGGSSSSPTASVSDAFKANCARCHGETGSGGSGPSLRGYPQSKTNFQTKVRNGGGGMPAFSATDYTDDNITTDYAWLISNP
jgi:mono/diheme cytochrome c family protein